MAKQPSDRCIMVCVTPQAACERLIAAGLRLAAQARLPLTVLSVFHAKDGLDPGSGAALERLYAYARAQNASMQIYFNDDPDLVVAVAAKKSGAAMLVTGFPAQGSSHFIARVHALLPDVPITMVDLDGTEYHLHTQAERAAREVVSILPQGMQKQRKR
ncbi:MAG: hypothetical protein IKD72_06295 [Clostridia bacterium]|nr:hypothetical protein [Clostridia bacterium]